MSKSVCRSESVKIRKHNEFPKSVTQNRKTMELPNVNKTRIYDQIFQKTKKQDVINCDKKKVEGASEHKVVIGNKVSEHFKGILNSFC